MLVNGTYFILGNWKMHLTTASAAKLASQTAQACFNIDPKYVTVGVAPVATHLSAVHSTLDGSNVLLGGQTCHNEAEGAFTGDVSAAMLHDCGCTFVIVGHSERRQHHHETNLQVCKQAAIALEQGLHTVICVGESLEQRESGDYLQFIESQLRESIPRTHGMDSVTVAYEPIWAIGTGKTASVDDISEVHDYIQAILRDLRRGNEKQATPRVLYGGSVKANNALDILTLPVVDGVLVGGASLDANAFKAIIQAAETSAQKRE